MIRLLLVDDHEVVRTGVRAVFADASAYDVVGEAATVATALESLARLAPDVVILDVSLPDGSGLEAAPRILAAAPATRILMLSVHDGAEYVLEAVRAGAHGYLRKDATPTQLRQAVEAVHAGGAFFGGEVAGHLVAALRGGAGAVTPSAASSRALLERLTAREREVLTLVAEGCTSKEVAARLGISVRTAEAHRDSIGKKTGLRSVAALTRLVLGRE
jgi:DNA-binding NarL/FixJ family response regulator